MPLDRNGVPLKVGDTVLLWANVVQFSRYHEYDDGSDVTIRIQAPEGDHRPVMVCDAQCLERCDDT